jgi:hypothetical protein
MLQSDAERPEDSARKAQLDALQLDAHVAAGLAHEFLETRGRAGFAVIAAVAGCATKVSFCGGARNTDLHAFLRGLGFAMRSCTRCAYTLTGPLSGRSFGKAWSAFVDAFCGPELDGLDPVVHAGMVRFFLLVGAFATDSGGHIQATIVEPPAAGEPTPQGDTPA